MADASIQYKRCPTCNSVKEASGFFKNKARPDGHSSECKRCSSKRSDRHKPDTTLNCRGCGQPFKTRQSERNRDRGKFCGPSCYYKERYEKVEVRFWQSVNKTPDCWLWTGSTNGSGYGTISGDKKRFMTHRLSWEIHNGSIPKGLCVLHKCDNPPCVNPEHLFLGTKKDNAHDAIQKGRHCMFGRYQPGPSIRA